MTESGGAASRRKLRRAFVALVVVGVIGGGIGLGAVLASMAAAPDTTTAASASPGSGGAGTPAAAASPTAAPTPALVPTPEPTPALVPAPLTGLPVSPEVAAYHPIAVMIDDHRRARPQAGFNASAVVWQAPAEGGIPRYMFILQDRLPALIGPVRSARQYYVDWAAEWRAVYVHVGGEPRTLARLRAQGDGELVWDVEERLYEGTYLWRTTDRVVPHNVYSDGERLRQLAALVGADDGPITPAWAFAPGPRLAVRPVGTMLAIYYPYETITYRYDAASNTYLRYIDGATEPQVDAADGQVVAPTNVVILRMSFGPLNDGRPDKDRLEADDVGVGEAIVSTGGRIIHGTWSKASVSSPTRLFDSAGDPVTLAAGQTFVQVITLEYRFELVPGVTSPGIGAGPR